MKKNLNLNLQPLFANLRTLCPQQKCVTKKTKKENLTKREIAYILTILAIYFKVFDYVNRKYGVFRILYLQK